MKQNLTRRQPCVQAKLSVISLRRIRPAMFVGSLAAALGLSLPLVGLAAEVSPTFKQVVPILFEHCVLCHRPGEIAAPIPLVSYETVRPWAKAIKQKVLSREMPPWPADPSRSLKFRNDARLSEQDIRTLVAWVDAGAPRGNVADLAALPKFPTGWLHPQGLKPDLVIRMPGEFRAPAKGEIPYVRFLAKLPFLKDKWISAIQTRAGNPALVHHMAITEVGLEAGTTLGDAGAFAQLARQLGLPNAMPGLHPAVTLSSNPAVFDMLGVYTPGTTFEMYGDDSARLLKGGDNQYINFNVHYQATGKPEQDRSMIGFWFRSGPPKRQVFRVPGAGETILANGRELLTDAPGTKAEGTSVVIPPIPPFASAHELTAVTAYPEAVTIYQFQPHAHLRAKDFTYAVVYPDGREQTVLTVPRYDFRWQLAYDLETPLELPAGSKLVVTAHYDNSRNNQFNPAPEKEVYFRDQNQSWDEMFTPFVQYAIDLPQSGGRSGNHPSRSLPIVQAVGCLEQSPDGTWMLASAGEPVVSASQATTSLALRAAQGAPLGHRLFRLLGTEVFAGERQPGHKSVVKGVLIDGKNEGRLNVTSLKDTAQSCTN